MTDKEGGCLLFIALICCVGAFGIGILFGMKNGKEPLWLQAQEHGYAQHSPLTGEWEWIEREDGK